MSADLLAVTRTALAAWAVFVGVLVRAPVARPGVLVALAVAAGLLTACAVGGVLGVVGR